MEVLWLHDWTDALRESPEFQYLHGWLRVELEAAVDSVEEGQHLRDAKGRHVLATSARTLLLRRSAEAMVAAVRDGAPAAVPRRLSATALPDQIPIHTVRGIEAAESAFLELDPPAEVPRAGTVPAVLLAPPTVAQLATGDAHAARDVLDARRLLAAAPECSEAGLCHEFIDYYGEVRADIVQFLPEPTRDVLEVGCGRGATGRLLQRQLGCRVTGVELNPVAAQEARAHLHRVICGDIDHVALEGQFDAVVACELFEHLTDPQRFLSRMRGLVRHGGRIVLSVPNVGHWSIVDDLIAGRWDYLPIGLLCHTHFRFYTRTTLETWLRATGFDRFEIIGQRTGDVPERFDRLAHVPNSFVVDHDSLATSGFYVVIEVE